MIGYTLARMNTSAVRYDGPELQQSKHAQATNMLKQAPQDVAIRQQYCKLTVINASLVQSECISSMPAVHLSSLCAVLCTIFQLHMSS